MLSALACLALLWGASRATAYEIGQTSVTYYDQARNNRPVPTYVFYPAETAGQDVPVAPAPEGGYAVVSLGHGFLIPWDDYQYLWEGLVPAGYVVALPATETGMLPSHIELGRDLAFVVRSLRAEGENPASPFFGAISEAGAVMGHSMGGGASILGAAEDPTVTAVANLAAAETNPSAIAAAQNVTAPALLFSGSMDCVTPPESHQIPMYQALASDCRTLVSLTGASHCQFAENNFTCSLGEIGCASPTLTRDEQHALTLSLLLPWLDYALNGSLWGWIEFEELLQSTTGITHELECQPTSVAEGAGGPAWSGPGVLSASAAFPNPFVERAALFYTLSAPADVRVRILSLTGRVVATIEDGHRAAGTHAVVWDGCDRLGCRAAAGVYACEVEAAGERERSAMVLVR